ncbi:MAG: hypothetical protein A3F54_02545 [Candidatus Kerfeldbacteria bacterium RIFCSPHIGHO2_12_FULL_48_17]|uniref:DUF6922 domain-containing protein n=1 Tax=Candidatus Kerfeldbacteria bacterium RIFCSPHIGHO2_12_FULL_48_17 TaxID=1798542 RepID=A0A1G2AXR5_9BACT|nr:MAG: hypothetical protein A3F54_02545 [Candidatus Kerfeldbacteria bacterium RIFCSPHIGHO2_12_FULL_48_17]
MKHPAKKPKIKFRQSLFWDTDVKKLDPKKHAKYIIERILDFGEDKEIRWMWLTYPRKILKDVLKNSRVLHKQTRALWQLIIQK